MNPIYTVYEKWTIAYQYVFILLGGDPIKHQRKH